MKPGAVPFIGTALFGMCIVLASTQASAEPYKLSPQDVINITIWQHEDLTRTLTIESDGTISFPLCGQINAGGKTVTELSAEMVSKISKYIPNPQLTVTVAEYRGLSVAVLGQVNKPGHYTIMGGRSLLDILAESGGLTDKADTSCVRVLRAGKSDCVDLDPIIEGKRPLDYNLKPGDTIFVPKKWWSWLDAQALASTLTLTVIILQIVTLSK